MLMIAYFTFKIMGFCMKHREEGLHFQQMLKLWAASDDFLQVWPVLAGYIHAKECRPTTGQLFLEKKGIGKDFSPVHVEGTEEDSMTTNSQLQSLLVQFAG